MIQKPKLDSLIKRFSSRKLLVWVTTTILLLGEYVESSEWVAIALVYIGTQGAADIARKWKGS